MIKNHLIVVMCNLPWDWSTDYPNQTASKLSEQNTVICFLIGEMKSVKEYIVLKRWPKLIKKYNARLYLFTPVHIIPFQRFSFIAYLNMVINIWFVRFFIFMMLAGKNIQGKILWVFDPQFVDSYKLFGKSYKLLYDCVDYFVGSTFDRTQSKFINKSEQNLLKHAQWVFTISHTLRSVHKKIRQDICVVPQGFRLDIFRKIKISAFSIRRGNPVVGYIGGINFRLDLRLLFALAKKNSHIDFVLVGPIQNDNDFDEEAFRAFVRFKNVVYLGDQPKELIPSIIQQFDISMLPYNPSFLFNKYSYPMKIFEYFYMGKPVISSYVKELTRFPKYIKIAKTIPEWENHIKQLLNTSWSKGYKREQRSLALANTWEKKIEAISRYLL